MMVQPKKFTHFIFDLDGTLIDTEQSVLATWQTTLRQFVPHKQFSLEELRVVLGITTKEALKKLGVDVGESFEDQWNVHYQKVAHTICFFPGVEDMLQSLKQRGYTLGIVSSRSRQEYRDYFQGFGLDSLCSAVVLKEDTQKHKPDAQPLLKSLELAKADANQCIYIGDMTTDLECAKNTGLSSGLVTWDRPNVKNSLADFIFTSPSDILNI